MKQSRIQKSMGGGDFHPDASEMNILSRSHLWNFHLISGIPPDPNMLKLISFLIWNQDENPPIGFPIYS